MNQLTTTNNHLPADREFNQLQIISQNAAGSGLYNGVGSEQKIFMILLAARELGIPPMQAINGGIWNIQGKIEISARLMTSMIRRRGHSIKFVQHDDDICILEGKRADNGDVCTASFSMKEAVKAGLAGRPVWKAYAQDMLYSRAISRLARRLFPDVIGTAYVEGEIASEEEEEKRRNKVESKPFRAEECEIIQFSEVEPAVIEDCRSEDERISDFLSYYADEDHGSIMTFLNKYATHYKKTLTETLKDYSSQDKFEKQYGLWRARAENQPSQ